MGFRTPTGCHIVAQGVRHSGSAEAENPGIVKRKMQHPLAPLGCMRMGLDTSIPKVAPWAMMLNAFGVLEMILFYHLV